VSLNPELLKSMDPEHALNALRHELGADFAWMPDWIESLLLPDWIESLLPDAGAEAIIAAAENYGLDAADVDALGGAYFESITHTCAVLRVLAGDPGFGGTPEELQEGVLMLRRLEKAGYTTLDGIETLLESAP
jgi:hypothetical protein